MKEKLEQVAKQCDAVVTMAEGVALVHKQLAEMFRSVDKSVIADIVGTDTHGRMEQLGDMLNNMDACAEDDAWIDGVFEKAREMFPLPKESVSVTEKDDGR